MASSRLIHRALADGIEKTDGFHRVAKEIKAERIFKAGREKIDDAAADTEFADPLDQGYGFVSRLG